MKVENIIAFLDDLLYTKTGKHLNSLQKSILQGTWHNLKYPEIAKTEIRSAKYVKGVGFHLWKLLSDMLKEDVNQANFRAVMEKTKLAIDSSNSATDFAQINNNNIINNNHSCFPILNFPNISHTEPENQNMHRQDAYATKTNKKYLSEMPSISKFYGRSSEISTLKQWILENHTRLITIYGLSGIGKTSLILKLINEIQTDFNYIIYRSIDNLKFITLKDDLKQLFSRSHPEPLPELIDYFCSERCLVILDDMQNIFETGKLPNQYLTEYQDYGNFFNQIVTSCHQSCLILISREKPENIENLEANHSEQIKTFPLQGLGNDAKEILTAKGLKDEHKWDELINLYQGHPYWLNIIASYINNYYENSVNDFLGDDNKLYLGNIKTYLQAYLQQLSDIEIKVMQWLAQENEPIEFTKKYPNIDLEKEQLNYVIQCLDRRCLLEKISVNNRLKFQLNPIFKALYL